MKSEPKSVSNPVAIVQAAYQEISDSYAAWSETARVEERAHYNDVALALLPPGSRLLELGCGDGRLTSASLAGRYRLLGLDLAPRQVNAARHHVPDAEFRVADALEFEFVPNAYDGVVAFYVLNHIPRDRHPGLLAAIFQSLRRGGVFLASFGTSDCPAHYEADWLGAPIYFSSYPPARNIEMVESAGFKVVATELSAADEFGSPVTFQWILAIRPDPESPSLAVLPDRASDMATAVASIRTV